MAVTKEDVLEFISGLSVLELSELVKEFEASYSKKLSIFVNDSYVIPVVHIIRSVWLLCSLIQKAWMFWPR